MAVSQRMRGSCPSRVPGRSTDSTRSVGPVQAGRPINEMILPAGGRLTKKHAAEPAAKPGPGFPLWRRRPGRLVLFGPSDKPYPACMLLLSCTGLSRGFDAGPLFEDIGFEL